MFVRSPEEMHSFFRNLMTGRPEIMACSDNPKVDILKDENEILALTGLRFLAAFYVFMFHIHLRWPIFSDSFMKNFLDQGAIGMSLFFMLSGFVLALRYADGRITFREYFINRFARIYPIYIVAAVVTLPWIGLGFGSGSLPEVFQWGGRILILVSANIFLIQAWFPQFFSYWNCGASWSISVEAFCYLLLPFLLPFLLQLSFNRLLITAVICFLLAVFPGISASQFAAPSINIFYSMPIFRLPEFLIGVLIYLVIRRGFFYKWGALPQFFVIVVFFSYLGFFGPEMPIYVGHNFIALPVIAFMIFSLSNGKGIIASIIACRFLVWLGKISYSFYSFQALIILVLISYHDRLVNYLPIFSSNKFLALISLVILIALSAIGFYFIEEPAREWIRRNQMQKFKHDVVLENRL